MIKKSLIFILIIIGIIVIFVLGIEIYFVSQFSAVYDPLKEFKFPVNAELLKTKIYEIVKNDSNFSCKNTDTIGSVRKGFTYYLDIRYHYKRNKLAFTVKYKNTKHIFSKKPTSELSLISVSDSMNKIVGYKNENQNIKNLVKIFEDSLVIKLKNKLNIYP